MRKLILPTLSTAVICSAALAQCPPGSLPGPGVITDPNNNPATTGMGNTKNDPFNLSPGTDQFGNMAAAPILNVDGFGNAINAIEQIEMRNIGSNWPNLGGPSTNTYYVCMTCKIQDPAAAPGTSFVDVDMVSGILTITGRGTGSWAPDTIFGARGAVGALNKAGSSTDEFQVSMSYDRTICVWDNYGGATYNTSVGMVSGTSFICTRTPADVLAGNPFPEANIRVIGGGIGAAGGVDPHIAKDNVGNGNILLAYIDFVGGAVDIRTAEVDPATGNVTNALTPLATSAGAAAPAGVFDFLHSPYADRDSNGDPRAITNSEYDSLIGGGSDAWWNENFTDTGTSHLLANQTITSSGGLAWFANPAVVGGTWMWATAEGGYQRLTTFEGNAVLDTDLTNGEPIVLKAPMTPGYPSGYTNGSGGACPGLGGLGPYASAIVLSPGAPSAASLSLTNPLVTGCILNPPAAVVTLFLHDPNTGQVELNLGSFPVGTPIWSMQAITFNICTNQILTSNVARLY